MGHCAHDCAEPPRKRPRQDTDAEAMVEEVCRGDRKSTSLMPVQRGTLDCGATTRASVSETIKDYLSEARSKGGPVDELDFYERRRPFWFSRGKVEHSLRRGVTPASFGKRFGALSVDVAPGRTPTLFPPRCPRGVRGAGRQRDAEAVPG